MLSVKFAKRPNVGGGPGVDRKRMMAEVEGTVATGAEEERAGKRSKMAADKAEEG